MYYYKIVLPLFLDEGLGFDSRIQRVDITNIVFMVLITENTTWLGYLNCLGVIIIFALVSDCLGEFCVLEYFCKFELLMIAEVQTNVQHQRTLV